MPSLRWVGSEPRWWDLAQADWREAGGSYAATGRCATVKVRGGGCNGLAATRAPRVTRGQRRLADPHGMHDRPSQEPGAPESVDSAADVDPEVRQLLGLRPPDVGPIASADEVDTLGEMTGTRLYAGDLEARPPDGDQPDDDPSRNLELLVEGELRDGETDDPMEAAEEGLTWVPPVDPPLRVDADGPEVAAGFGTTATDEPYDADHHAAALSPHDEIESRVLEALRADAATAGLADRLEIDAEGGVIRIAGAVEDLEDEDAVLAVASAVHGVTTVDSRVRVRTLETERGAT